jgi:hypothetical protein
VFEADQGDTRNAEHSALLIASRTRRVQLPNVPAIGLANSAKYQRIVEDLNASIYESFHCSFIEPLPRTLLEELLSCGHRGESVEQMRCITNDVIKGLSDELSGSGDRPVPILRYTFAPAILASITPTQSLSSAAAEPGQPPVDHASYYILNLPASTKQHTEEEIERVVVRSGNQRSGRGNIPAVSLLAADIDREFKWDGNEERMDTNPTRESDCKMYTSL